MIEFKVSTPVPPAAIWYIFYIKNYTKSQLHYDFSGLFDDHVIKPSNIPKIGFVSSKQEIKISIYHLNTKELFSFESINLITMVNEKITPYFFSLKNEGKMLSNEQSIEVLDKGENQFLVEIGRDDESSSSTADICISVYDDH